MARFNMPVQGRLAMTAAVIVVAAPHGAFAGSAGPEFRAALSLELEAVSTIGGPGSSQSPDEATVNGDAEISLVFPDGPGLHATLVFEPVTDTETDRYFRDFGLYAEELYLSGPVGSAEIRAGKLNLAFGLANDEAPGMFGDEIAGEYELTERIGVAAEVPLARGDGAPSLLVAAFMADTTPLAASLLTRRERLRRRDGGVSNTAAPESALITLSGSVGETVFSSGLRYQRAGRGDAADEFGAVAGATRDVEFGGVELGLLGEAAYFPRYDGAQEPALFVTLGAEAEIGDVTVSAVYGQGWIEGSPDIQAATFGLDYLLAEGVTLSAAYQYRDGEDGSSHDVGLRLTFEFETP